MTRRRDPRTLDEARTLLAISVPAGAAFIGVSEAKMCRAVATGKIPAVRVCGRVLICAVPFLAMFGVESDVGSAVAEASASLDSSHAHECESCRKNPERGC